MISVIKKRYAWKRHTFHAW